MEITDKNKKTMRLYIAFNAFALGYFVTCIFRSVNAVQAPYFVSSLHISIGQLGVLTSSYLLAFGLAQIPLGILLDKFGVRITQTLFFILAGFGVIMFAQGNSTATLALGRFIIGLGASGGLMAAFKANVKWFPEKLPFMNDVILAVGGFGALVAARPTQLLIAHFGWREFNWYLAVVTFLSAILIHCAFSMASIGLPAAILPINGK